MRLIIKIAGLLIIPALVFINFQNALAGNSSIITDGDIPEQAGLYSVKGSDRIKVRVFVHKVKQAKPGPLTKPSLICGLDDPDAAEPVSAAGWHLPEAFTYSLNPYSAPSTVGSRNFVSLTETSFAAWSASSGIKFNRGSDYLSSRAKYDGKNLVAYGTASRSVLGITYIWYDQVSGRVLELDTLLNKRFSWSWTPYSSSLCADNRSYDAQNIMMHEIGHWMGLDDEYENIYHDHTMYGYGDIGEIKKDSLTSGDIAGLRSIY